MNLILKIALGVFIGIVAVIVAFKIPAWIDESREEDAEIIMNSGLTAEMVIEKCGKPLSDKKYVMPGITERRLRYDRDEKLLLTFFGTSSNSDWHFAHMEYGTDLPGRDTGHDFFVVGEWKKATSKLTALPCLKSIRQ